MSDDDNGKFQTEHRELGECHMVVKTYEMKGLDSYCFCNTPAVYSVRLPNSKPPHQLEEDYRGKFCRNHYLMMKSFEELEDWLEGEIDTINEGNHDCQTRESKE